MSAVFTTFLQTTLYFGLKSLHKIRLNIATSFRFEVYLFYEGVTGYGDLESISHRRNGETVIGLFGDCSGDDNDEYKTLACVELREPDSPDSELKSALTEKRVKMYSWKFEKSNSGPVLKTSLQQHFTDSVVSKFEYFVSLQTDSSLQLVFETKISPNDNMLFSRKVIFRKINTNTFGVDEKIKIENSSKNFKYESTNQIRDITVPWKTLRFVHKSTGKSPSTLSLRLMNELVLWDLKFFYSDESSYGLALKNRDNKLILEPLEQGLPISVMTVNLNGLLMNSCEALISYKDRRNLQISSFYAINLSTLGNEICEWDNKKGYLDGGVTQNHLDFTSVMFSMRYENGTGWFCRNILETGENGENG